MIAFLLRRRLGALAALLLLGACGLPDSDYFGHVPEPEPGHLRICLQDPQTLDPGNIDLAAEWAIISNLFEPLVLLDERLRLQPALAESWHASPDYRTFTFSLRPDARFSNGRAITAEDVRFTVVQMLNPLFAANRARQLYPLRNAEAYNAGRAKVVLREISPFRAGETVEVLDATEPDPNLRRARTSLGFRGAPSAHAEVYASVGKGAEVTILDLNRDRSWAFVYRREGEGVFGWVESAGLEHPNAERAYRVQSLSQPLAEQRRGTVLGRDLLGLPDLLGVRVIDARTIAFDMEDPTPYFPLRAAFLFPVAAEVVSRWPRSWFRPGKIVTSGPFVVTAWTPRHRLELVRSDTFFDRERVGLERITVHVADDQAARANLYYAGYCDLMFMPPPAYRPLLVGTGAEASSWRRDVTEHHVPYKSYVFLNAEKLRSASLRRALARSIDRRELHTLVPGAVPTRRWSICQPIDRLADAQLQRCGLSGDMSPEVCVIDDRHCYVAPPFPDYDRDGARRDLAAARNELRRRFSRPLTIRYPTSRPTTRRVAEWLQANWQRELGLEIEVQGQDQNTLIRDIVEGAFDMFVWGWLAAPTTPEDFLLPQYQCGHYFNSSRWCDADYDRLLARAQGQSDLPERLQMLRSAETRIADQVPAIPLYVSYDLWLAKPYVREFSTTGRLHRTWIDPDWKRSRP